MPPKKKNTLGKGENLGRRLRRRVSLLRQEIEDLLGKGENLGPKVLERVDQFEKELADLLKPRRAKRTSSRKRAARKSTKKS